MTDKHKAWTMIFTLILPIFLTSCAAAQETPMPQTDVMEDQAGGLEKPLSAWVAYWDLETVPDELAAIQDRLEALCHFSAVFNADGRLVVPKSTSDFHRALSERELPGGPVHYLTVTNDVIYKDRPPLQKDAEILKPLLFDAQSRAAHIEELLRLTERGGYDGLEIDYEAFHRENGLAVNFALFCGELSAAAGQRGLRLRIVLESSFPVDKIQLPGGPDYVIMLYNLYGYHSGPGPKADFRFIRKVMKKMKALPGKPVYAFSTGGFDWNGTASPTALNESQAQSLLLKTGSEARRDADSGCLSFTYTADNGESHTVWFADGETLQSWMDLASREFGITRFALWRLGGNKRSSLARRTA